MTTRATLRDYQEACVSRAIDQNTIVHLPTNTGKTLIAVRTIEHFLKTYPDKRAVFLVPTQVLVEQQTEACLTQINLNRDDALPRPPKILQIMGSNQHGWRNSQWKKAFRENGIFLGTPEVFHRLVATNKYLHLDQFSVVVFDECHHATGGDPMAAIMHDAVHPHYFLQQLQPMSKNLPRILGLTSTFSKGRSTNNLQEHRRNLELLLNSTIFSPDHPQEHLPETRQFFTVKFGNDEHHTTKHIGEIEDTIKGTLQGLAKFKDMKKIVSQCSRVFSELGRKALMFYVAYSIIPEIRYKISYFEAMTDNDNAQFKAKKLREGLPLLQEEVEKMRKSFSGQCETTGTKSRPPRTKKLQCLLELLATNMLRNNIANDTGYRGIIFVDRVALVSTLAQQIEEYFKDRTGVGHVRCSELAGAKSQSQNDREENVEAFRNGDSQILVSTAAGEEGLDVPDCKFVLLYSRTKTTESHMQRIGRARHTDAELYYMENDPNYERRKAAAMTVVAKDDSLALSFDELRIYIHSSNMQISFADHLYPSGDGVADQGVTNLFNSGKIFFEYCRDVLSASIYPREELYCITEGDIVSIRCPTPNGWKYLTKEVFTDFWGDFNWQALLIPERVMGKSCAQKRLMAFLFVAVVYLRRGGLLDEHNQATEIALLSCKRCCPLRVGDPCDRVGLKAKGVFTRPTRLTGAAGSKEISLERAEEVFRNFTRVVLKDYSTDLLFLYSTAIIDDNEDEIPSALSFPTPNGWERRTYEDYDETFQFQELNDQLERPRTKCEKVKIGMFYLAVLRLLELGYLNGRYEPNLTPPALSALRIKCTGVMPAVINAGTIHSTAGWSGSSMSIDAMSSFAQGNSASDAMSLDFSDMMSTGVGPAGSSGGQFDDYVSSTASRVSGGTTVSMEDIAPSYTMRASGSNITGQFDDYVSSTASRVSGGTAMSTDKVAASDMGASSSHDTGQFNDESWHLIE